MEKQELVQKIMDALMRCRFNVAGLPVIATDFTPNIEVLLKAAVEADSIKVTGLLKIMEASRFFKPVMDTAAEALTPLLPDINAWAVEERARLAEEKRLVEEGEKARLAEERKRKFEKFLKDLPDYEEVIRGLKGPNDEDWLGRLYTTVYDKKDGLKVRVGTLEDLHVMDRFETMEKQFKRLFKVVRWATIGLVMATTALFIILMVHDSTPTVAPAAPAVSAETIKASQLAAIEAASKAVKAANDAAASADAAKKALVEAPVAPAVKKDGTAATPTIPPWQKTTKSKGL